MKFRFFLLIGWILLSTGSVQCSGQNRTPGTESLSGLLDSAARPPEHDQRLLQDEVFQSRQNAITRAVSDISPAVVGINVTQVRTRVYRSPFSEDPFFRHFFPPHAQRERVKSLGSGFLISSDGYILTNEHVVHEAEQIVVTATDGTHHQAVLVGKSEEFDVALLKIEGDDFPYIPLGDSDEIIIGEWVIALGNPFGLFDVNSKPTVTVGVISAVGMNFGQVEGRTYNEMIQTDASINGGNSGGPLVNSLGQCVGINAFIISGSQFSSTSVGIGFAIPINRVKRILPDLKQIRDVERPVTIGLAVDNINWLVARMLGISERSGVIVTRVEPASAADEAGLAVGDVIVAMDGYRVRSTADVRKLNQVFSKEKKDRIALRVYRGGRLYDTTMSLR